MKRFSNSKDFTSKTFFLLILSAVAVGGFRCASRELLTNDDAAPTEIPKMEIDRFRENAESNVRELEAKLGLMPLRSIKIGPNDETIRINNSIQGLDRFLVLTRKEGNWTAEVFEPKVLDGDISFNADGHYLIRRTKLPIGSRESSALDLLFGNKELIPPFNFQYERSTERAVVDEGVITLQIKRADTFDIIAYSTWAESQDAQVVLDHCRELEKLLYLELGCSH